MNEHLLRNEKLYSNIVKHDIYKCYNTGAHNKPHSEIVEQDHCIEVTDANDANTKFYICYQCNLGFDKHSQWLYQCNKCGWILLLSINFHGTYQCDLCEQNLLTEKIILRDENYKLVINTVQQQADLREENSPLIREIKKGVFNYYTKLDTKNHFTIEKSTLHDFFNNNLYFSEVFDGTIQSILSYNYQQMVIVSKWSKNKVTLHGPVSYVYLCKFVKIIMFLNKDNKNYDILNTYEDIFNHLTKKKYSNNSISVFDLSCKFYNSLLGDIGTFDITYCGNNLEKLTNETVDVIQTDTNMLFENVTINANLVTSNVGYVNHFRYVNTTYQKFFYMTSAYNFNLDIDYYINIEDLEINNDNIANGEYGEICLAYLKRDNVCKLQCVVKKPRKDKEQYILSEFFNIYPMRFSSYYALFPHVIGLSYINKDISKPIIVTEYFNGCTLYDVLEMDDISKKKYQIYNMGDKILKCCGLFSIYKILSDKLESVHGDLHPHNILVSHFQDSGHDGKLKIVDPGFLRKIGTKRTNNEVSCLQSSMQKSSNESIANIFKSNKYAHPSDDLRLIAYSTIHILLCGYRSYNEICKMIINPKSENYMDEDRLIKDEKTLIQCCLEAVRTCTHRTCDDIIPIVAKEVEDEIENKLNYLKNIHLSGDLETLHRTTKSNSTKQLDSTTMSIITFNVDLDLGEIAKCLYQNFVNAAENRVLMKYNLKVLLEQRDCMSEIKTKSTTWFCNRNIIMQFEKKSLNTISKLSENNKMYVMKEYEYDKVYFTSMIGSDANLFLFADRSEYIWYPSTYHIGSSRCYLIGDTDLNKYSFDESYSKNTRKNICEQILQLYKFFDEKKYFLKLMSPYCIFLDEKYNIKIIWPAFSFKVGLETNYQRFDAEETLPYVNKIYWIQRNKSFDKKDMKFAFAATICSIYNNTLYTSRQQWLDDIDITRINIENMDLQTFLTELNIPNITN